MMKISSLLILLLSIASLQLSAQQYRYFEFYSKDCAYGNWQDSVFVAAASNQQLIDTVLTEINKPFSERRFINGPIDYGNGGFNYNASHAFLWHHIPDQWSLVDAAIELCDGCPYSGIDLNLQYFIDTVGHFCPWGGRPLREIQKPTSIENPGELDLNKRVKIYPNPGKNIINIDFQETMSFKVEIFPIHSSFPILTFEKNESFQFNSSELKSGLYFVRLSTRNVETVKKLIIQK